MDTKALEAWLKERPLWLQDAARRLLHNGEIAAEDKAELVALCKQEAGALPEGSEQLVPQSIPPNSLIDTDEDIELKLIRISNVQGVNALAPRAPLEFGDGNLTIVFGRNGAGKSGYVRILKHACGARHLGRIHGNIRTRSPASQTCTFGYMRNGTPREAVWDVHDGVLPELAPVEIYDTHAGEVYVNDANEVAFEPSLLSFFQQLVDVSDDICREIDADISAQPSQKPSSPPFLNTTEAGAWYQGISASTSAETVRKRCAWTDADEARLGELSKRLAEPNPADRAAVLRKQKASVDTVVLEIRGSVDGLSPKACRSLIEARVEAKAKRQAADIDAQRVFEDAPLDGVGTATWRLLWEQARKFSESEAYLTADFPEIGDDARCVLCHQPLANEAKDRFRAFEKFVRGGLELQAKAAEQRVQDLEKGLPEVLTERDISLRLDSAGITEEKDRRVILDLSVALAARKAKLLEGHGESKFTLQLGQNAIKWLKDFSGTLEAQAATCDKDAKEAQREELERGKTEAEAHKWLADNRSAIEGEIARLKRVTALERARRLTNTRTLTSKKSELSEALITQAYVERFDAERKALGASNVDIEIVKAKAGKGRIYHAIRLKNNALGVPAAEVLSEGEFRIISLAAFLADAEGRDARTPIIFDDPISSLDQDYEEATVARLTKLSSDRQVIVFTHRISLLVLLQTTANKQGIDPHVIALEREPWGAGEPSPSPFETQKPKAAINTLLTDVKAARRTYEHEGRQAYELKAQAICTKLRKTLEKIIEDDLLAGVVCRFRREIQTMNKLDMLPLIELDDTRLLDEFMTKYSIHVHLQPVETPAPIPGPDELNHDLERLQAWRESFEQRKKH